MENVKHIVDKENNKFQSFNHEQLLYLQTKISSSDFKELKNKAIDCLENQDKFSKANKTLAGNMEKEFHLNESFEKILFPYSSYLAKKFDKLNTKIFNNANESNTEELNVDFVSTDSWINFQKKHEYNPIHQHSGDYSFVLWIQIPYDLKEELELNNCVNANTKSNSLFSFTYTDIYGKIVQHALNIDKTWEGTMILFSANLNHTVYPFYTSDDYRISISGNLLKKPLMSSPKKIFSYK